jgi:hypothetical protein
MALGILKYLSIQNQSVEAHLRLIDPPAYSAPLEDSTMKIGIVLFVFWVVVGAIGCSVSSDNDYPEIQVSVATEVGINMCAKEVGKTFTWQNFQIRNIGDAELTVSQIAIRGDAECAFKCYRGADDLEDPTKTYACPAEGSSPGSFQMTIPPGESQILKIEYTPSGENFEDQAALVITSDTNDDDSEDELWQKLVVPMCGIGTVAQGDWEKYCDETGDDYLECKPPKQGASGCAD